MKPARIIKRLTGVNTADDEAVNNVEAAIRVVKMDEALAKEYPAIGLMDPEINIAVMPSMNSKFVSVILSVPMPCQHDCPTGVPARNGGYYTHAKVDIAFAFIKIRDPNTRAMEVMYHMARAIWELKQFEKEMNGVKTENV